MVNSYAQPPLLPAQEKSHIDEQTLYLIGSKLLRFVMREFIWPQGAYHDKTSDIAQHPDLCDYIGNGGPMDTIEKNRKVEEEKLKALDMQTVFYDFIYVWFE